MRYEGERSGPARGRPAVDKQVTTPTTTDTHIVARMPDIHGFRLRALARAAQWRREGDTDGAALLEFLAGGAFPSDVRRSA